MPCDPAPNEVATRPRRRSLLADMFVVCALLPPYVVFYPFLWVHNRVLLRRWKRESAAAVSGRWQLEGDRLRLCLAGDEHVVDWSAIRTACWTEHRLTRRFIGTDESEYLVRLELEDGRGHTVVLGGVDEEHAVFARLRAEGKLGDCPRRGGEDQSAVTMTLFGVASAMAWATIVLVALWLRALG